MIDLIKDRLEEYETQDPAQNKTTEVVTMDFDNNSQAILSPRAAAKTLFLQGQIRK